MGLSKICNGILTWRLAHEIFQHIIILLCIKLLFVQYVADSCRVILKGEYPDYINAVFVNVSITTGTLREVKCL